jgi:sterol desaturase/sphingolipid hydroxylase (fatty acid hydroxylase superfamily)
MILGNNCHFMTYILWGVIRLGETTDGHSGYEFSWSPYRLIPFATSSAYHAFHHSHNIGNYSSFFNIWDTYFQTNKVFYQHYEKAEEARIRYEEKKS